MFARRQGNMQVVVSIVGVYETATTNLAKALGKGTYLCGTRPCPADVLEATPPRRVCTATFALHS